MNTTSLNGFNDVHVNCGRERGREDIEREREGRKEKEREKKDTCSMTIDYFMTYNHPLVQKTVNLIIKPVTTTTY